MWTIHLLCGKLWFYAANILLCGHLIFLVDFLCGLYLIFIWNFVFLCMIYIVHIQNISLIQLSFFIYIVNYSFYHVAKILQTFYIEWKNKIIFKYFRIQILILYSYKLNMAQYFKHYACCQCASEFFLLNIFVIFCKRAEYYT